MNETEIVDRDEIARSEAIARDARHRTRRIALVGTRSRRIEVGRRRLVAAATGFAAAFLVIAVRLVEVTLIAAPAEPRVAHAAASAAMVTRADIVDRNGVVLATSLPTRSLYADPTQVLDAETAARRLAAALPDLDPAVLRDRLSRQTRFVWLKRNLTPRQQAAVHALGIPGLAFLREERRVYPHGALTAHVVGFAGIDNRGLAGAERRFDERLSAGSSAEPVALSIDVRVQHVVREELAAAVATFDAVGGNALVLDVESGEIRAMVSLPDFDPHDPGRAEADARFNRNTLGVYEMGSTFKIFTAAMALDRGVVSIEGGYDASEPMRVSRFLIRDFKPKNRWLSVPEIMLYSSNIGAARMALDVGSAGQRAYFDALGLTRPLAVELPERGLPMLPEVWREINTVTAAYGHGIAVTPLHLASGVAAVINGGILRPATVIDRATADEVAGVRVITPRTSELMRALLRLVVAEGTGRRADSPGYFVGGKTGTAEKIAGGRYQRKAMISSFIGAFPIDAPRYVVLVMLDEPKGTKATHGYATGGWTAAPAVGAIVGRVGPMLGLMPRGLDLDSEGRPLIEVRHDQASR